ncbi:MAG: MOSC domain-containing protein [Planctomycetaceae bacterium]
MTATILSVQVGKVRTEGESPTTNPLLRKWTTGFYKYPVNSPVMIRSLGLEGDGIADHRFHGGVDKAVLGYGANHYPQWRSELLAGDFADPAAYESFGPGAFAENLTIGGQDETNVCLGDRYLVGHDDASSVVLEVSQPRQPCWKISRRWQHRTLTKRVAATGRTGWYLRVLREGHVAAGDAVTLLERPHPQWPVARANDVLLGRESNADAVAELLAMEVLAAAWKQSLA